MAFSDSPTHLDKISGPLTNMILIEPSFANALAINVFPHPGGPNNSAPLAGLIPIFKNFSGVRSGDKKLLMSKFFSLANPPMSSHFMLDGST
jgi:hypothetical protein